MAFLGVEFIAWLLLWIVQILSCHVLVLYDTEDTFLPSQTWRDKGQHFRVRGNALCPITGGVAYSDLATHVVVGTTFFSYCTVGTHKQIHIGIFMIFVHCREN